MENLKPLDSNSLNHISSIILDSAIAVHKEMGPGLLEAVYQHCMVRNSEAEQLDVKITVPVSLHYKGESLNKDYIIDMLVENEIIVELKAIEGILKVHEAQIISYLKLAKSVWAFDQF